MGSVGLQEIIVIMVIALIVFGPKKLPEIGRSLGQAIRELRKVSQEFTSVINLEDEPETRRSQEYAYPPEEPYDSEMEDCYSQETSETKEGD